MIERIHGRADFRRLGRSARRVRRGPLTLVASARSPGEPAGLAFAIPKQVGPAVVRNRLRRQLRAAAREIDLEQSVAPGWYLVVVHPGARGEQYQDLRRWLESAFRSTGPGRDGP